MASDGFRRFALGESQVFPTAARTLRNVFPLRQFLFVGRVTLPSGALAGADPGPFAAGLDSLLAGLVLLPVVVARALGHRHALAEFGQCQSLRTVTTFDAGGLAGVYRGNVVARPLARISTDVVMLTGRTLYA